MNCPVCANEKLVMSERQGVEIDYCPSCRGVWLDRGELDKIIERSDSQGGAREMSERREDDYRQRDDRRIGEGEYGQHRKKRSFLSDLFEFGD